MAKDKLNSTIELPGDMNTQLVGILLADERAKLLLKGYLSGKGMTNEKVIISGSFIINIEEQQIS